MRKRSIALSIFSGLLLFLALLIVVLHFIFGFQYVLVLTDSMEPKIHPGDLVIVYPSPNVKPGDVILYRLDLGGNEYLIIHRVIDIGYDENGDLYYVTKGDNRKYPDPWRVYPEQVIGKLLVVVPLVGRLYYYLPLLITASLLGLIALVGYELVKILVEEEEEKPSRNPTFSIRKSRDMYMLRRARRHSGRGHL